MNGWATMAACVVAMGMGTACASAGTTGTAAADRASSSERVAQPLATNVAGECRADGGAHEVRHVFAAPPTGSIKVTTTLSGPEGVAAHLRVRRPDGKFVQQVSTSPREAVYQLSEIPSVKGDWEVVVACSAGASAYTMRVVVAPHDVARGL